MPPAERQTIVDCSGVGAGGITRVLTELVRHWPAGDRLDLVAAPAGWAVPDGAAAEVGIISRQGPSRTRTITAATAALRHATGRVLALSPSLAVAACPVPVTTVVHDLAFRVWPRGLTAAQRRYRSISYAAAVRRSACLLCVSDRTRHDLLGRYGTDVRAEVWHPGSDLPPPGKPPEALAHLPGGYLAVAGHAPHKGVELAIDAVADLDCTLAVLTGGAAVPAFRERAAGSNRIVFLDRLADDEYAATVAGAAAFLMPSHFEGYGLPAVEALRLGTPTVISPDPALAEATAGAAVRMESWTAGALRRAIDDAIRSAVPALIPGRSWRAATADLAGRITVR
jgi:glycosyltransferase involved in cell wall biosynthesis